MSGGVIFYLIDNQYYFKRHGLYGHYDDAERFAFFSRAALEMLPYIDFKPDIIHCNDWQTALVPIYYSIFYANNDWYKGIKTIFTIHNIQYQGKYGKELIEDVLGIPESATPLLEYGNCVNLLKGGVECANRVTTVSPTYAQEILDPWYAYGLEGILQERKWKLIRHPERHRREGLQPGNGCGSVRRLLGGRPFRQRRKTSWSCRNG